MTPMARKFLERYPHPEERPVDFCRDFNALNRRDRDECLAFLLETTLTVAAPKNDTLFRLPGKEKSYSAGSGLSGGVHSVSGAPK